MHERPGPQYNRGNDPTTAVGKIKNATPKNDTKGWWAESSVADVGEGPDPLIFRPKRGPKGRKIFYEAGPPRYLRVWMTTPPPLSEGLLPLFVLLGKKEKWRLCLNRVEPLFEVVAACRPNLRTYLSWSLKNVPLRAELRCIGHYRAGVHPGFQTKTAQKLYPIPILLKSPILAWEPHRKEKTHKRGEPILI